MPKAGAGVVEPNPPNPDPPNPGVVDAGTGAGVVKKSPKVDAGGAGVVEEAKAPNAGGAEGAGALDEATPNREAGSGVVAATGAPTNSDVVDEDG